MKWSILAIISIVSCSNEHQFYQFASEDPICWPELNRTKESLLECFNLQRFETQEAQAEIITMFHQHSEDEQLVRQIGEKYCKIGADLIECLPIYFNVTTACQPVDTQLGHILERIIKRTLDYFCDNRAEVFVQLMTSNGVGIYFMNNQHVIACTIITEPLKKGYVSDPDKLIQYCNSLQQSRDCHIDWMKTHDNVHLINTINELYLINREEFEC